MGHPLMYKKSCLVNINVHLFQVTLPYSYLEEEDPVKKVKVKEERHRNSKEVLNIVTETATETARRSFHECHCCGWGQII